MFLLCLALIAAPADASAQSFVDGIYSRYVGKEAGSVALAKASEVRRLFAPALADRILKDRAEAAKREEVPALDGDPFVNAQDWDIPSYRVNVESTGAQTATATVDFTNGGKAVSVKLDLSRTKGAWRIVEVHWASGALSKIFAP